jgi:hypothetical protein
MCRERRPRLSSALHDSFADSECFSAWREQEFKAALDVPGIDEQEDPPAEATAIPEPPTLAPAADAPGAVVVRARVPASVLRQVGRH